MEESYLPEYSDYQATEFTQGTWGIYLQLVKILAPDPSPILRYSECTKTISFSILGVFSPGVKLGFDFAEVLPNQKFWYWSLNIDFDEEINPMLGSLKIILLWKPLISRSSDRSKTENARNQILLRQKDAPFNGELA